MEAKMTEQEKKQLTEDIKSGKVDIYKLYKKYGLFEPYFMSYEAYKRKKGEDKTMEDYENAIENSRINFLLAHM